LCCCKDYGNLKKKEKEKKEKKTEPIFKKKGGAYHPDAHCENQCHRWLWQERG
jgi:hypothetical protein